MYKIPKIEIAINPKEGKKAIDKIYKDYKKHLNINAPIHSFKDIDNNEFILDFVHIINTNANIEFQESYYNKDHMNMNSEYLADSLGVVYIVHLDKYRYYTVDKETFIEIKNIWWNNIKHLVKD